MKARVQRSWIVIAMALLLSVSLGSTIGGAQEPSEPVAATPIAETSTPEVTEVPTEAPTDIATPEVVTPAPTVAEPTFTISDSVPTAITGVSIRETVIGRGNVPFTIDITWTIPDSAQEGDTFTLDLGAVTPQPLMTPGRSFQAFAPDGVTPVANVSISGNIVTFTLTDYVDSHVSVTGTTSIGSIGFVNFSQVENQTHTLTFVDSDGTQFVDTIQVLAGSPGPDSDYKWGQWGDSSQTFDGALIWWAALKENSHRNITIPSYTVVDTAGEGWTIDCDSFVINQPNFASVESYTVNSCSDTGFSVTLYNVLATAESRMIQWTGTPTQLRSAYDNYADLLAELPTGPDYTYDAFRSIETPQDIGQGIGEVLPIDPTVVQATCNDDAIIPPSVTPAVNSADIVYTESGSETPGGTVIVTATTQGESVFPGILPIGWVRVSDTVATFTVILDPIDCSTPTATATATSTPTETATATVTTTATATSTLQPPTATSTATSVPITNFPNTCSGSSQSGAAWMFAAIVGAFMLASALLVRTRRQN